MHFRYKMVQNGTKKGQKKNITKYGGYFLHCKARKCDCYHKINFIKYGKENKKGVKWKENGRFSRGGIKWTYTKS